MKLHSRLVAFAFCLAMLPALAQEYPSRPVKLVVPFPPGSATDVVARLIGYELQGTLGQPFIVDNKAGAQAMIGTDFVAKSPPDGYTILVAAVSFAAAPSLFKSVPFDPLKSFAPVAQMVTFPLALMVKPDFPAKTMQEFIAYAKAHPGKLSAGHGSSSSQICISQLSAMAGLQVTEVPYKGIPLAVTDVLSGTLDFTFADLAVALPQVKGGALRMIAVTSAKRNPLAPDVPAIAEVLPGYDLAAWLSLFAPAGTPKDIIQKLYLATGKALAKPDVVAKLAAIGLTPTPLGPEELGKHVKSEVDKWARLVKQAGIQPE
jgi:tripartite-type tricarboxylate transporter receptor subunit TctC